MQRLVYTVAPKLGTRRTVGPQLAPPPRGSAGRVAEAAVEACEGASAPPAVGWELLSAAWGHLAVRAAEQFALAVGHDDC